jgi:hypothetical protein
VLIRRLGNNKIGQVFPGYGGYAPLGVVQGADIEPDYASGGPIPVPTENKFYMPGIQGR